MVQQWTIAVQLLQPIIELCGLKPASDLGWLCLFLAGTADDGMLVKQSSRRASRQSEKRACSECSPWLLAGFRKDDSDRSLCSHRHLCRITSCADSEITASLPHIQDDCCSLNRSVEPELNARTKSSKESMTFY